MKFQKFLEFLKKKFARAERKKIKHFLGYGPEAPRLARAVRARARALSIGKKLIKELMKKIMILLMIFSDTCSETSRFISACHLDHTVS